MKIPTKELRFLAKKSLETPVLCYQGCLSGIRPIGPKWTKDNCDEFEQLIADKNIYAEVLKFDENVSTLIAGVGVL